ncbi:MAG: LysM peptidoglycan-binding domain-containing protein [Kiritimatiellae bacterium]|nr:LysM peptidoglycan-binding domain-containing protein [Kiritimatiellia bacterium]
MSEPDFFCVRCWRVVAAGALAVAAGCVTYTHPDDIAAMQLRHQEDLRLLQEQIRTVQGRVEGVEMEAQRLAGEVEALRRALAASADGGARLLQPKLQELETRLARLDAAREQDRQAIVDELSKRMAEAIRRAMGGAAPAAASSRSPARRTPGPTSGYEHVVQPGETLSAIAAAYGVSAAVIAQENNIADPSKLRAGQKLFIPER